MGNDNEAGRQAVTASEPFQETLYGYGFDEVAESCSRLPMSRREIQWLAHGFSRQGFDQGQLPIGDQAG